ncbi:uncharacterized protein RJT20DRAFT_22471 [Scheffersomyces xylosifermentans]|uniref:uncharacterized protein n=1 Tax=Scheffersomyces xylosifermentans TaxID=1304137 RepID=UPI00315C9FCF
MSSNDWTKPSYSAADVDDFIIADEDESPSVTPQAAPAPPISTQQGGSSSSQTNAGTNLFSQFAFVPKVDLSSTFAPFTSSNNLPANNKVRERQYTGGDTLDEPILATLKRDLFQIGRRLAIVIWPMQLAALANQQQSRLVDFASSNGIQLPASILNNRRYSVEENDNDDERNTGIGSNELVKQDNLEWDLWGPLIFSLVFSVTLGFAAPNSQTNSVFSGSFSFVWIFFIVIGLNIQLLGGSISFMSAISAAGYSMFPIVVGALISCLILKWKLIRLAMMLILNAWSIYAGTMSLECSGVLPGRVTLAIYPVALMYSILSWLVVIT